RTAGGGERPGEGGEPAHRLHRGVVLRREAETAGPAQHLGKLALLDDPPGKAVLGEGGGVLAHVLRLRLVHREAQHAHATEGARRAHLRRARGGRAPGGSRRPPGGGAGPGPGRPPRGACCPRAPPPTPSTPPFRPLAPAATVRASTPRAAMPRPARCQAAPSPPIPAPTTATSAS